LLPAPEIWLEISDTGLAKIPKVSIPVLILAGIASESVLIKKYRYLIDTSYEVSGGAPSQYLKLDSPVLPRKLGLGVSSVESLNRLYRVS